MPHLENCLHSPEGWCLQCVKELWEEKDKLENDIMIMRNKERNLEQKDKLLRNAIDEWIGD